jgi:hypothetical protein
MQIKYKIVGQGAAGVWLLLLDTAASLGSQSAVVPTAGADALMGDIHPSFRMKSKKDALPVASPAQAAGSSAYLQPLGNVEGSLSLKFLSTYASEAVALSAIRQVGSALKTQQFHLLVTSSLGGSETQYYPNCICDGYDGDLKGVSVEHNFSITTQDVTATAPTN